jgi:hypothetical protein
LTINAFFGVGLMGGKVSGLQALVDDFFPQTGDPALKSSDFPAAMGEQPIGI